MRGVDRTSRPGLSLHAPPHHRLLLLLRAVLQLKFVKHGPVVADVGVERHRAVKPTPSLFNLTVEPKQIGDGRDDSRVVVAPLERVSSTPRIPFIHPLIA